MTNSSDEKHCYKMIRGDAKENFELEVVRANGDKVAALPTKEAQPSKSTSSKTECLDGRATLSQSIRLNELFDVTRPDTYRVRVSRFVQGKSGEKIFSNVLTFRILP
jgi:hypothetical protein